MGDYQRTTREIRLELLPEEIQSVIQRHIDRYNLGAILDDYTIGVETVSVKKKKGLFKGMGPKRVTHYAILTPSWLVYAAMDEDGPAVALSVPLVEATIKNYALSPAYARLPDRGYFITGNFPGQVGMHGSQQVSMFLGLGEEKIATSFGEALEEAIAKTRRQDYPAGGIAASMMEQYKNQFGTDASRRAKLGEGNVWAMLMEEARKSPPGANGIFFLPHFNGTTCPNLDPRSLGAFLGLNDTTMQEDMVRAVVEGLDYAFLDMLKALEHGAGQKAEEITVIGGGTRNAFWMQNKADVAGCSVITHEIEEATALGAAMLAGVGSGMYASFDEAVKRVDKPGKVYEPNAELSAFYAEMFDIYREIYPALSQVNNKIYNRFRI